MSDGDALGDTDGFVLGISEGINDGVVLGTDDGSIEGKELGLFDGTILGIGDGANDGDALGDSDGSKLGISEGTLEGDLLYTASSTPSFFISFQFCLFPFSALLILPSDSTSPLLSEPPP